LRNYIKEKFHPAEIEDRSANFEKKYNDMNNKIDEITKQYEEQRKNMTEGSDEYNKNVQEEREKINEEMKKFFREDMQSYVSGTKSDINTLKQNKDSQINDLKAQLH
jgi:sugar-specific transcriptional regulator TrmB